MHVTININAANEKLANVRELVSDKKQTDFWQQCVRDIDGEWIKYIKLRSLEDTRYFYGHQPHINYENPAEVNLLQVNIDIRHEVYKTIGDVVSMDAKDFQKWLESLRYKMQYRPTEEWKLAIHATTTHTDVVLQDIIPIAKEYDDPYALSLSSGPIFNGFPKEALPIDEVEGDFIKHTYPSLEFSGLYFDAVLYQIRSLHNERHSTDSYIRGVANLYQLLINLHYFPSINTSLYMNIANGLLEVANIKGVDHGIKDFVAMRLQPKNYQDYFRLEVLRRNT